MNVTPGNPTVNGERMLEMIEQARGMEIDLLVFPEMCLPGYLLGDMWERLAFLKECEAWTDRIIAATADSDSADSSSITVVFGTVITEANSKGEDGRVRKYNGFIVAQNGRALRHAGLNRAYGIKSLLPNYREFEEPRHFYDTRKLALEMGVPWESLIEPIEITLLGHTVRAGILLCEDAWDEDYAHKPLETLGRKGCDFFLNLSCSPFTQGKNEKRNRLFGAKVATWRTPLLYVNCVSLQNNGKTIYTFEGRSTVYGADGTLAAEMAPYLSEILRVPLVKKSSEERWSVASTEFPLKGDTRIRDIHLALRYGIKTFLESTGQTKVVIGLSGGIDSAVAAALFGEILPPEDLLLVNMPSAFNSQTTRILAKGLAKNLQCLYTEVGIEDSMALTQSQLDGLVLKTPDGKAKAYISMAGFMMENVQARDRSSRILAALAASFGGVFTCNANKAELTVGYSTLYGDLGGFLVALGDLWKSEVYALGRYLNETVYGRELIPEGVFTIVPSAELNASQAVDEGKGDPMVYPYHDRLFYSWVQRWNRATPEEILEWYANGTLAAELGLENVDLGKLFPDHGTFIRDLERWWNLYSGIAVAKRVQAPPILAVSSRTFGFDHRESLGGPFYSSRYLALRKSLLEGSEV